MNKKHIEFMREAIVQAKKGRKTVTPNPAVGALLVKNNIVIGSGYHRKAGGSHAEVLGIKKAKKLSKGATLFVTLEPCSRYGRTSPCTEAVINAGIKKVVIGAKDPNPNEKGRSIRILRRAGIEVVTGVLRKECEELNRTYNKFITKGLPFVTLKLATSLDGKIATKTGESKWITSEQSRRYVHTLRSEVDCIMVGSGTLLADNPRLTVRGIKGKNPARAVLDSTLRVSLKAHVFASKNEDVFVFTSSKAKASKVTAIEATGATVITLPITRNGLDLKRAMQELGARGLTSVLVEGGGHLSASLLKASLVDKVLWFSAPILLGSEAIPALGELNINKLTDAKRLKDVSVDKFGSDTLTTGYF
ncbi:MAG: bifunctional diaminohydroxyphosphoribosylaminopyrimidine deaminase/5-amino-6-(5-phosphoribosylamino)uracil reductase RibD [Deltaproteobacteria bacterium]|nr:bifunctional diaminohydroxyphosphoribosylaminopyrimidine deaminase/5-amino-6-(5-phosphoribosylamino)uracil reductase RibD [Deltaproteobacteria bacterium]